MSNTRPGIASRINAARVTIDDLLLVTEEVHKLPPDQRDWEGRAILMIKLFPGDPDKTFAIEHRLQAMNELIDSGVLPHWTLPKEKDGTIQIARPVWQATAEEPLLVRKHDAHFNKDRFLERVLSLAEPDGRA